MGFRAKPVRKGDAIRSTRWNEHEAELERLGRVRASGGLAARQGGGGLELALDVPELIWIQVTGSCGPDKGYPYQQVYHLPPIQITAGGSGYSYANATVSGGGGAGATLACTVDPSTGAVTSIRETALGTAPYTSAPSISIAGDGSGAAAGFSDPQWVATSIAGDGMAAAAYPLSGSRTIAADSTVYPAIVAATTGKLVFLDNGGGNLKAYTPSGGIGQASLSGTTVTPGSAMCTIYTWTGSTATLTTSTELVYNFVTSAPVAGNKVITIAELAYGIWECILEPC